ncbi:tight adherence protein B [Pararobbsia alpina]
MVAEASARAALVREATVSSTLLAVLAVALFCVVGALWLWHRASLMQQSVTTQRFVDSRLAATPGAPSNNAGLSARPVGGASGQVAGRGDTNKTDGPLGDAVLRRLAPHIERMNRIVHRAGVLDIRRFYSMCVMLLAGVFLFVGIETNFIASTVLLAFMLIGLRLWLWHRSTRQQRRIVTQLPEFLDGVVRMITIGNSVPAAFQAAAPAADLPLRTCLERASRMMRAGVELDKTLNQLAELYVVEEFMLIASVVRLSVRYGGRADQVLERMAAFMRDREMAQRELFALSAETRLSAWILGLLPLVIGCFIVLSNPDYFVGMWFDPTGRHLFYGALGLQLVGVFLLYRLAKL